MAVPADPKIYHIVHVDRLPSIVENDFLWCDAKVIQRNLPGTTIGMTHIKQRRLQNILTSHPGLCVGDCVPFYFCPRSVMLYVLHNGNHPDLAYQERQAPIVHLEAGFYASIEWAKKNGRHWAFTTSNAGSSYFEDYCDAEQLDKVNWKAVQATQWQSCKEGKQAEFLMENSFPWLLVERIGVYRQFIGRPPSRSRTMAIGRPSR